MEKEKIYLKDVREELPLNCIYNKVRVGCGGTTLALESDRPYVICVPYVSLIDNKIAQNKGKYWLGVKAGVTTKDISRYLMMCEYNEVTPKIMVTYDSLSKVNTCINPKDYYLLIDEYHILFQQYSFRTSAIRNVLESYKNYKAFTFMSATPLETDFLHNFIPAEMSDIPIETQDWSMDSTPDTVTVEAVQCTSVKAKVIDIIQHHLLGHIDGNAYFFVNSCSFIDEIYNNMIGLNKKSVRVIYSKNNHKRYDFERGETTDKPKKINFLTSTAFEGCDIYDENGMIYMVSDGNSPHTLLDISSSVQQIAGRIRNSRYKSVIMHIFSKDRYIGTDPSKFEESTIELAKECKEKCDSYNSKLTAEEIEGISIKSERYPYLLIRDSQVVYDENLRLLDVYNYIVRTQYKCKTTIETSYHNAGNLVKVEEWKQSLKDVGLWENRVVSFKDAVKECREASLNSRLLENLTIQKYEAKYPMLPDAIEKLGYSKIATLSYVQKDIKDQLLLLNDKGNVSMKVIKKMNLSNGQWISASDIKKKLQQAYNLLGVNKTAKATDIATYYSTEECVKNIGGKRTRGYIVYLPLFKTMK